MSLISIYTYDILLHPLLKNEEKWLHRNLGRFYQIGWLLPVVGISFYLNVRMFIVHITGATEKLNIELTNRCLGVISLLNGLISYTVALMQLPSHQEVIQIS